MDLSVVVPVYQCAPCLRELHARLTATLAEMTDSYELVFVEDCGTDDAWDILTELAGTDSHVRAFQLSRNFGQHAAITAGLQQCRGAWAVVMDGDLQDPPEEIPRLWQRAHEGFDIVYANRARKAQTGPRQAAARLYFRFLRMFNPAIPEGEFGTFSIISRSVIDAFLRVRDLDRHYLLILYWLGFPSTAIDYQQHDRYAGESSYSFGRLVTHALDGVFFQTTVLLRGIVYLGFVVSAGGALLSGYSVYRWATGTLLPGWTSVVVLILLIGGMMLVSTGIAALYIGKIFDQVKERPLYLVRRQAASDSGPPPAA